MRQWAWMLMLGVLWGLVAGCGQSSSTNGPAPAGKASSDSSSGLGEHSTKSALAPPAQAVYEFLEAVRKGDDVRAEQMLTSLARKKTREMNMVVAPPGSDTASFEVGKLTMLDDTRAEVLCKWTDREPDGTVRTDEIIWLVRKEPEGWRVAGMAAKVFPDQPPYPLNFEDPEDMLRQQEKIKAELARREAANRGQAPATSSSPSSPPPPSSPPSLPPVPPAETAQNPTSTQPLRR